MERWRSGAIVVTTLFNDSHILFTRLCISMIYIFINGIQIDSCYGERCYVNHTSTGCCSQDRYMYSYHGTCRFCNFVLFDFRTDKEVCRYNGNDITTVSWELSRSLKRLQCLIAISSNKI